MSLVWMTPHQARTPTMEKAVKKLAACTSNGSDWPYILVQLYEGSDQAPLPKGKHLGILSQGEVEETSRGQISQLDICQLLSAGPQVIYPSSLNGHDKHIITTLPEPLSSGKSIIANEHSYLEIDISFKRELDTKALLIGKASVILKTTPPKSSPEPKCSMATEVDNLLTQAMADTSSCKSEQSSLEKTATVAATTSPPCRSEVHHSTSQHIFPSQCRGSRRLPRGCPHQHFCNSSSLQQQKYQSPCGPIRAPGQCQQSH